MATRHVMSFCKQRESQHRAYEVCTDLSKEVPQAAMLRQIHLDEEVAALLPCSVLHMTQLSHISSGTSHPLLACETAKQAPLCQLLPSYCIAMLEEC